MKGISSEMVKGPLKRFEIGIAELFFGLLMAVGIIGYFGQVSADLNWLDHSLSLIIFTYLFYRMGISSILFGRKNKGIDAVVVISFFLLFFKDIIGYTILLEGFHYLSFVESIKDFFLAHLAQLTLVMFYAGITGLALAALAVSFGKFEGPSLVFALGGKKITKGWAIALISFILLLAFYHFVYNLLLEWLEFALDDPIIVVGILFYVHSLAGKKEQFHADSFIFRIGSFSENLYTRFVSLFHYKKTLPLALSGLLILHALADLGVYAYALSVGTENFYLEQLRGNHLSFAELWKEDMHSMPINPLALGILYTFNALSLVIFLLIPVLLWWQLFSRKRIHLNPLLLFAIYASGVAHLLMPAYAIGPIDQGVVVGVDISSFSIIGKSSWFSSLVGGNQKAVAMAVGISILVGGIVGALSFSGRVKKWLGMAALASALAFYGIYIYYFMGSVLLYFFGSFLAMLKSQLIAALILLLLALLTLLFYVASYVLFLYEIAAEYLEAGRKVKLGKK